MVGVPEQPSVVFLGQRGHPALAVGGLEFVLLVRRPPCGSREETALGLPRFQAVIRDQRGELTAVDLAGRVVGDVVDDRQPLGQLEVGDQLATVRPQLLECHRGASHHRGTHPLADLLVGDSGDRDVS